MSAWSIWVGAIVLFAVGAVALWVLFGMFGAATAQDEIRIRLVQLAGTIVLGAGGAVGLLLAARKQRSTELSLRQTERDLEIKAQAAEDAHHDAAERRVTELFNAAAEQLGSDKAPVRMAALYTLERLGQDNPGHRHTVVKLLCAYLRLPFAHPYDGVEPRSDRSETVDIEERRQELDVRLTAQHVLTDHLRPGRDDTDKITDEKFWPNMSLDLSGAVLHEFDLSHCEVTAARFERATFQDGTSFIRTVFYDEASFIEAVFYSTTSFGGAIFHQTALFYDTTFGDDVGFNETTFHSTANFMNAMFHGHVVYFGHQPARHGISFHGARRLWETDPVDEWPNGWLARAPQNAEEGHIAGFDGVWGFVVEDRQPKTDAETQVGPPESSP